MRTGISKASFDSNMISRKDFQMGDLVLKWDKAHEEKGTHIKFQRMWLSPFQIVEVTGPSTFMLQDLAGKRDSLLVNGQILKKYFRYKITLLFCRLDFYFHKTSCEWLH